ncbi:MAG: carbon starvation protein A [Candidatus Omnitrophica bacterium]|nr:carbon starvation protein A [Candidatus Omnitrophota bacterium]
MNSAVLLILILIAYASAFRLYGSFLSRTFNLDPNRKTPAEEINDGTDFVPAKNWIVLFGHHFSSICGAGPIIGPVLAVSYWGWGVSVVWIFVGAILMGAVADFSSLIVSVRSRGQSISVIAGTEISDRAKWFFSVFLWVALILVVAVFSIFGAKTFIQEPDAVVPSFGLIPVAMIVGWMMYRTRIHQGISTVFGLSCLAFLLAAGVYFPLNMPVLFGMKPDTVWIVILLIYCFFASVMPVQILLQPRDYLASFILFAVIVLGLAGIFTNHPQMQSDFYSGWENPEWAKAGPLWPMMFVTVACGAISGFHSVVSSGTTCKQLSSESHACRIGYGGMLLESVVAVMVLICVGAGMSNDQLRTALQAGGPISAFSQGYGAVTEIFLGGYGKLLAVLGLNAFILTTLDSATRITRYLTSEVFGINNKYLATGVVVLIGGGLALSGQWVVLWPAFGASNQLIAAIALLITTCWLMNRGKSFRFVLIPAVLMMITTMGAFTYQLKQALTSHSGKPDWMLVSLTAVLIILGTVVFAEALRVMAKKRKMMKI